MNLSRRTFLKGLAILPVAAYAPALLAKQKIKPLPEKVEKEFWIQHTSYLDNIVALYGIQRKYGETDEELRKRTMDVIIYRA